MNNGNKALRSFFGARAGGQDRPQDINTPQFLLDAIYQLWPEGIALDPCSNETSIVRAERKLSANDAFRGEGGLDVEWPNFTYANPPYKNLKHWMVKIDHRVECLMLCPVRTNRIWWCDAAAKTTSICWLRSFPFLGHKQTFPAPLAMLYYGFRQIQFLNIFREYGRVGTFDIFDPEDGGNG
jgi:hypothetical protein